MRRILDLKLPGALWEMIRKGTSLKVTPLKDEEAEIFVF